MGFSQRRRKKSYVNCLGALIAGQAMQQVKAGIGHAIAHGLAYSACADMPWCETASPCRKETKKFTDAIHAKYPDQLLTCNYSPSGNCK